ncbi:DUF4240 domain-containing protein, partial [Streptomyces sp. 12297]
LDDIEGIVLTHGHEDHIGAVPYLLREKPDIPLIGSKLTLALIGQGREVFEGAVHDPDHLAELLGEFDEAVDGDGEELGYAADEAYEQLTGAVAPELGVAMQAAEPEGAALDFENEAVLAERYPRLWDRFRSS